MTETKSLTQEEWIEVLEDIAFLKRELKNLKMKRANKDNIPVAFVTTSGQDDTETTTEKAIYDILSAKNILSNEISTSGSWGNGRIPNISDYKGR